MSSRITFISIFFLSAAFQAVAKEPENYFLRYNRVAVPVINETGNKSRMVYLFDIDSADLIFRTDPESPRGEFYIGINAPELRVYYKMTPELRRIFSSMDRGDYELPVQQLRSIAYPMVRFLPIPPDHTNIHQIVERFIHALRSSGRNLEAARIFGRMDLEKVPPAFTYHAMQIALTLVKEGKSEAAKNLIERVPLRPDTPGHIQALMDVAYALLAQGEVKKSLILYQRIQSLPNSPQAKLAILWSAYGNLLIGRYQATLIFLNKAKDVSADESGYALKKLILAKMKLRENKYKEAMYEASHGLVAGNINDLWMPEVLFTVALCYKELEDAERARAAFEEIKLFFPESKFAKKANQHLLNLKKPPKK